MDNSLKKKRGSYHHKNLRQALLTLTREMISEEGIESVTLRELARRLNISRTAPYRHFKDKSSLLAAVAHESYTQLNLKLLQDFQSADTPLKQLELMMVHYVRFAVENPDHYKLMFGESFQKKDNFPELAEVADETFAILTQAIFLCQEHRLVAKADARDQGFVVWSALHGLARLMMDGKILPENRDIFANMVSHTLINGLKIRKTPPT